LIEVIIRAKFGLNYYLSEEKEEEIQWKIINSAKKRGQIYFTKMFSIFSYEKSTRNVYDNANSRNITDIPLYAPIMPILDKDESTPYIL
jgi:hypothetical protein